LDGVDGILGLRFKRAAGDAVGAGLPGIPLAALYPPVNVLELDLDPAGTPGMSLGSAPLIGCTPPELMFHTYLAGKESAVDLFGLSFTDIELPFVATADTGSSTAGQPRILLSTTTRDDLVLARPLAEALGYDSATGNWGSAQTVSIRLLGIKTRLPIGPAYPISKIRVADLAGLDYSAVLSLDRWQAFVLGFDFVDYQGGLNGVVSLLRRDDLGWASRLYSLEGPNFVALPGLNSMADDVYGDLSDDGQTVVFQSNRAGGQGGWDVYVYRVGQGLLDLSGLNSAADDGDPSVSGDGRFVTFHSDRAGNNDIYLYDVQARAFVDLPGLNTEHLERNPDLSADGTRLAFRSARPGTAGGSSDLFLYDLGSKRLVPLAHPWLNTGGHDVDPALSADGRLLAFNSRYRDDSVGHHDVYLYDAARDEMVDLRHANSAVRDSAPALSPDGGYLAFVSERNAPELANRGRDLFLLELRTGEFLFLPGLNSHLEDSAPALTTGGAHVLFHSKRPSSVGGYDLYLYRRF
ncbi:MAG: TolB family protein, partial [Deferrisomatales bacterium]